MEQSQKRKKKKVYTKQITALVFLGLLIILCIFNVIPGSGKAEKPKLTLKAVLDGGYMEDYGKYLTDRFLMKGAFQGLDFSVRTMFGERESEGIWRGEGQYLLEEIAAPDEESMEENIRGIEGLAETYLNVPVYVMLVPDAANIQSEKLPAYAVGRNQEKQFKKIKERLGAGVNWVDVSQALRKHDDEALYYRTDRNWTSLGAFYGYGALAAAMELDTSRAPELTPYVVNNDYIGPLSERSGYGKGYEDSVTIYAPKKLKDSVRLVMTNMDTDKTSATLYDSTKLEKADKYSLFLGGDAGMIDIKTTADTTDRLLIFKDSSANCLIPFLTPYYREIVAVDPALYEGNIQEIMQKAKFTSILFLYSGNSFVKDTYISRVLGTAPETAQDAAGAQGTDGSASKAQEGAAGSQEASGSQGTDGSTSGNQGEDGKSSSDVQTEESGSSSDGQNEDGEGNSPGETDAQGNTDEGDTSGEDEESDDDASGPGVYSDSDEDGDTGDETE